MEDDVKASIKLLKMMFFLVIYIHLYACFWWIIVKEEQSWLPPLDIGTDDKKQIYSSDIGMKYVYCLHLTVLLIMGCDIWPRTTLQTGYAAFGMFMGAIINANIFGELAVIMASMGNADKEFQIKYNKINSVLLNLGLKHASCQRIRDDVIRNNPSMQS